LIKQTDNARSNGFALESKAQTQEFLRVEGHDEINRSIAVTNYGHVDDQRAADKWGVDYYTNLTFIEFAVVPTGKPTVE
jgi:hypothetical protein